MRMSQDASIDSHALEQEISDPLAITWLEPTRATTGQDGAVVLHSPVPSLVVLLSKKATLSPGNISLSVNSVVLIPASVSCRISAQPSALPIEVAGIELNLVVHGLPIADVMPRAPIILAPEYTDQLKDDITVICRSSANSLSIGQTAERLAAGYRIAHVLSEELDLDSAGAIAQHLDPEVRKLGQYLQKNYHLPLTIEDIASTCGVSRRQIFKIAARLDGITPMRLLKRIRLEQSLVLLHRKDLSVARIAKMVGFGDAKNFSREFRKKYGMTALHYRRQEVVGMHTTALVKSAESSMRSNPKRAAELFDRAITSAPHWSRADELHYKAGLAFRQAGDFKNSQAEWDKVSSLHYRLRIAIHQCEHMRKSVEHQRVVDSLRHVYRYGNDELRRNVVDHLADWMEQCALDENYVAARSYCEFAKELVSTHVSLEPALAQSLYMVGQYREIPQYCPQQEYHVAAAMRAAGFYQDHFNQFPYMRRSCALLHLRRRQYDVVLDEYTDFPALCVWALCDTGRFEEAIDRYPRDCARALLALGRYEEVDYNRGDDEECMWAMVMMGKEEEVLADPDLRKDLRANLLLYLERPDDLGSGGFELVYQMVGMLFQGIHLLEQGKYMHAIDKFEWIRPMTDPTFHSLYSLHLPDLLIPIIRHLISDALEQHTDSKWPAWYSHYHDIIQHHRYREEQRHWYDMRYVLGEINDAAYKDQPCCIKSDIEIEFVKGLRADVNGRRALAVESYNAYMAKTTKRENVFLLHQWYWPVKKAFIRWRLKELG